MASVDVSQLTKQEKDELVCAYSALLLHDGEQEVTVSIHTSTNSSTLITFGLYKFRCDSERPTDRKDLLKSS